MQSQSEVRMPTGRVRRGRPSEPNVYRDGLEAIFADDAQSLDGKILSRMAFEMQFAAKHHVPTEFVNGFVSQCRKEGIALKWSGDIHPTYGKWVEREQAREAHSDRGSKPEVNLASNAAQESTRATSSYVDKHETDLDDDWEEDDYGDNPSADSSDDGASRLQHLRKKRMLRDWRNWKLSRNAMRSELNNSKRNWRI